MKKLTQRNQFFIDKHGRALEREPMKAVQDKNVREDCAASAFSPVNDPKELEFKR